MPNNQKGLVPIIVIFLVLVIGGISLAVIKNKEGSISPSSDFTKQDFSPSLKASPAQKLNSPKPSVQTSSSPSPTATQSSFASPTTSPSSTDQSSPTPTPSPTPVACSACGADVSRNGTVDIVDFSSFRFCQGKLLTDTDASGRSCSNSDTNQDGEVDMKDFDCIKAQFG